MKKQIKVHDSRLDSSTTVFLERDLTSIDPRDYLELFAGLKAMQFVPSIDNIAPYDKAYEYSMWSITGEAANLGANARDLPRVGVTRTPHVRSISSIGASYGWSLEDIRAAAQRNVPLDRMTVIAAMTSIKRRLDRRIALGDTSLGYTGLLNDADIISENTVASISNFSSAANKLDSLNALVAATRARLKLATEMPGGDGIPAFDKFQILLPPVDYAAVKQTPASSNYPQSILQVFLDNNSEWVSGVSEWGYLDQLDNGTEGRAVCYPLSPVALGHATARYYTEEPPQPNGLNIDVPCHAASGGTVIRYPVAFSYMRLGA